MNNSEYLLKELNSLLLKSDQALDELSIIQIRKILSDSAQMIKVLIEIVEKQSDDVKFINGIRFDAKHSRNLEIITLYEKGATLSGLAKRFGITRQRAHSIVKNNLK